MKAEIKKAVVIYVPVIHQGYVNFLAKYRLGYEILLIDSLVLDLLPKFKTYFKRDVRKVGAYLIKAMLSCDQINCHVLPRNFITNGSFFDDYDEVVMPDEDVSREILNLALSEKQRNKVKLVPIILRFDKTYASKSFTVDTAIPITKEEFKEDHMKNPFDYDPLIMRNAKELADKSKDWWRQVSAIAVIQNNNGNFHIGAYNKHKPSEDTHNIMGDVAATRNAGENIEITTALHAEASVIAQAAKNGIPLKGGSMYVTTFPCPACARIIAESGISKLYFEEGYSRLEGKEVLEEAGIKIFRVSTKEDEQTAE
jgi:dCMP deaminase